MYVLDNRCTRNPGATGSIAPGISRLIHARLSCAAAFGGRRRGARLFRESMLHAGGGGAAPCILDTGSQVSSHGLAESDCTAYSMDLHRGPRPGRSWMDRRLTEIRDSVLSAPRTHG